MKKIYFTTILISFCALNGSAQLFKKFKKNNISNDPNIIKLPDAIHLEDYPEDPSKDISKPIFTYLYNNLLSGKDTLKVKEYMIKNNISFNFAGNDDLPILVHAIRNGNSNMVKLFLNNGANPNLRTFYRKYGPVSMSGNYPTKVEDIYSIFPIVASIENLDTSELRILKDFGADIETVRSQLEQYVNDVKLSRFIKSFLGSDKVAEDALWLYIHFTAKKEMDFNKIKYFIDKKSNINYREGCLLKALENGYSNNIIEYFIKNGADVNKFIIPELSSVGRPPVWYAVCNKNLELLKILVSNGANINIKIAECSRGSGETPLSIAIKSNQNDMVEYLMEKGAKN
jgi:ankyrin repeat protein